MGRAARCRTPNPGNRDRVRSDVECARLASRLRGFRGGADRARGQLPRLPSARRRLSCPAPRRQGLEAASPSVFRPRRSDPDRCRGRISIRLDSPFGRTSQTDLAPRGLDGIHRGGGVHRGLAGDFEELEAGACRRSPRAAVGRSPQSKCECPFALGSGSRTRRSELTRSRPLRSEIGDLGPGLVRVRTRCPDQSRRSGATLRSQTFEAEPRPDGTPGAGHIDLEADGLAVSVPSLAPLAPDPYAATAALQQVGDHLANGVRPLSDTARHAFGFLMGPVRDQAGARRRPTSAKGA